MIYQVFVFQMLKCLKVIFYLYKIFEIKFVGENKVEIFFLPWLTVEIFFRGGGAIWVEIFFDDGVWKFFSPTSWMESYPWP